MLTKKKLLAEITRVEKAFLEFKMNSQIKIKELEEALIKRGQDIDHIADTLDYQLPRNKEKIIEKKIEDQNKN